MPGTGTHEPMNERQIRMIGKHFGLLVKPASADCNLGCGYCFYHDRPTDPYRSRERHRMSDDVLASMISQYLSFAGQYTSFSWQGGEPLLMGIGFFRRVIELQQMYGYSGQFMGNSVQTNATLLTPDLAELFHNYNFLVGVSLDGPEEYHDHYRKRPGGHGTFHQVMEGAQMLREYDVEFNILSVVNDLTVRKPDEIYSFFLENGFHFLQYIPAVEFDRETGRLLGFSVTPEDYGNFLCRLFDLWYNNGQPAVSIRMFDNIASIYMGRESEACVYKDKCGTYAVVEYNGDVYPCDFFVEEPLRLGNLMDTPLSEIIASPGAQAFNRRKSQNHPQCRECKWGFICRGGCQHYRDDTGNDYLCSSYKQFFAYSEDRFKTLAQRLKRQQAIERQNTAEIRRAIGRNDPCPCGSGKKYKKCCMLTSSGIPAYAGIRGVRPWDRS